MKEYCNKVPTLEYCNKVPTLEYCNKVPTLEYSFHGRENKVTSEHLKNGETCRVTGIGNSMTPILKSRQDVICEPVTEKTELHKRDIVLAKVNGRYYLHLIHAIKNDSQFLIGNNHGHMNGWVSKSNVFGKVVEIL